MSSLFLENGKQIAVTYLSAFPLTVTQTKDSAVQVAYGTKKRWDKATRTKLDKISKDLSPAAFKEFTLLGTAPDLGSTIKIDEIFAVGDKVSLTGVTKGRGFAGVIKRYGFQRQPVSGGQSDRVRAPGAIGAQTPGKVVKGKKMPGHMGHVKQTVGNLRVVAIDITNNQIAVSGSIPGPTKSWLIIRKQS